jgi:hypothetical protein
MIQLEKRVREGYASKRLNVLHHTISQKLHCYSPELRATCFMYLRTLMRYLVQEPNPRPRLHYGSDYSLDEINLNFESYHKLQQRGSEERNQSK